MAEMIPFRGVRYDTARIGAELTELVAPPYDVISAEEQEALHQRHPLNIVRLILNREQNKYAAAAELYRGWLKSGELTTDPEPSLYVYRQRFQDPLTGEERPERMGLVCALKLEEYSTGKVLPHENTISSHKADRLELIRASNAQFESIYGLYSDPDRAVESFIKELDDREPVFEEVDNAIGSTHFVERISDASAINVLAELLADKQIFIADGHHRYETGLNYARERRAAVGGTAPLASDYILITLTAFEDEGLLVLPTHRLVRGVDSGKLENLPKSLADEWTFQPADREDLERRVLDAGSAGRMAFGLALGNGAGYLATLNASQESVAERVSGVKSAEARALDVSILQSIVLDSALGIDPAALAQGVQVGYTRSASEALSRVQSGEYQAAFLLGRPSVDSVRSVSLAGDKMPQKSTYFYPKLLSGLLMRDLNETIAAGGIDSSC